MTLAAHSLVQILSELASAFYDCTQDTRLSVRRYRFEAGAQLGAIAHLPGIALATRTSPSPTPGPVTFVSVGVGSRLGTDVSTLKGPFCTCSFAVIE